MTSTSSRSPIRCFFHRSHLDYGIDVGVGPDPRDPVPDRLFE
jgi:hypothetical protein